MDQRCHCTSGGVYFTKNDKLKYAGISNFLVFCAYMLGEFVGSFWEYIDLWDFDY